MYLACQENPVFTGFNFAENTHRTCKHVDIQLNSECSSWWLPYLSVVLCFNLFTKIACYFATMAKG